MRAGTDAQSSKDWLLPRTQRHSLSFQNSRNQESCTPGMGQHPETSSSLPYLPEEGTVNSCMGAMRPPKATGRVTVVWGWQPFSCFVPENHLRGPEPEAGSGPLISCQGLQASSLATSGAWGRRYSWGLRQQALGALRPAPAFLARLPFLAAEPLPAT